MPVYMLGPPIHIRRTEEARSEHVLLRMLQTCLSALETCVWRGTLSLFGKGACLKFSVGHGCD